MTIRINKPLRNAGDLKTVSPADILLSGRVYTQAEFDLIREGFELVERINRQIYGKETLEQHQRWLNARVDDFNRKAWEVENGTNI